jgi:uncharacterized protein YcaQ
MTTFAAAADDRGNILGAPASTDFVTREEARYLSLVAQRIEPLPGTSKPKRPGKSELIEVVQQAGVVQLDSISVVSRAHETVVWSRVGAYDVEQLCALHYPDSLLFEYWAHAASLLPIEFLPFVRRKMLAYREPHDSGWGRWAAENRPLLDEVLRTVEALGPVSTRAFERPEEIERRPWDWFGGKPAKQALDCLWTMGKLVILRRIGFERIYELTDRAFPALSSTPLPAHEEEVAFFTRRALSAVGIGTLPWVADYYRCGSGRYAAVAEMLGELDAIEGAGGAHRVTIEDQRGPAWLDAALVPALADFRAKAVKPTVRTLLCPFDNLLWRRDRALALFDFDYRLESYTPEPKRIYGYYTLPILIDGRFVGRLDARYRRKDRILAVQSIHLEPGVKSTAALAGAIIGILRAFVRFLGGGEIDILVTRPDALRSHIAKRLD